MQAGGHRFDPGTLHFSKGHRYSASAVSAARLCSGLSRVATNLVTEAPLVVIEDCTPRYLLWLEDPEVNRNLETRWRAQSLETIRAFVARAASTPR